MLESLAEKVTLIHRRDKFRAHEHSIELLRKSSVDVKTPWEIASLKGDDRIRRVQLKHCASGLVEDIEVDAIVVNFGFVSSLGPITEWGLDIEQNAVLVDSRSSSTLFGLRLLVGVLPAVFLVLQICVVWFDLTEEKQAQIARDLAERRKNATTGNGSKVQEEIRNNEVLI